MNNKKIAVLQPEIPHYRTEFFERLRAQVSSLRLYTYNKVEAARKGGFNIGMSSTYVGNVSRGPLLFYNPLTLLRSGADTLVLMLHFGHLTTWLLLLTKWIHRKKIILWGQGISVKRYLKEEQRPNPLLKWQMALADGVWLYMDKEAAQWQRIFPHKPIVALRNTLTGVEDMLAYKPAEDKDALKRKHGISQPVVLLFCARFENNYRRTDLLEEAIRKLDAEKYGFVIIGAGHHKPDFSIYNNVYDFGAVYDTAIKRELFSLADLYFQPGWVGLSIVEAMAYGLPVCTFRRTEATKQCVEYSYITDGENGLVFEDMTDCLQRINALTAADMQAMGECARALVAKHLTPRQMAENALSLLSSC